MSYLPATVSRAHAEDQANADVSTHIDITGQLIELSSTSVPTTIVVRDNPTGEFTDYTVDITSATKFGIFRLNTSTMDEWMTGDSVRVVGEQDANTGLVEATLVINRSINPLTDHAQNGWITAIDATAGTMTVQWMGTEHTMGITDNTRLVVPPNTEATLADFQIGDRVRARLVNGTENNEARFVVALRRGEMMFLKARTRPFQATLDSMTVNADGTGSFQVTLGKNPALVLGDVNNLIGVEGDVKTITFDTNTHFVRRYLGTTTADEFVSGDQVLIIGRANDDGTISARLVRDNDMWMKGVSTHFGTVTSIDTNTNTIVVSGTNFQGEDQDVTLTYNDDVRIDIDGEEATESDIAVGDTVHVRGVAHTASDTYVDDISAIGVSHE